MPAPESKPPLPGLMTVADCAAYLRVSEDAVERFIRAGELPRVALSSRNRARGPGPRGWRVRRESLEAFVKAREGREVPRAPRQGAAAPLPRVLPPPAGGPDGVVRLKRPRGA